MSGTDKDMFRIPTTKIRKFYQLVLRTTTNDVRIVGDVLRDDRILVVVVVNVMKWTDT
jgi:hypothetical protein